MKRLIVITGDLASGKTTLADKLSTRLGIPVFEKDLIKESLCDVFGFASREENLKLSKASMDQMLNTFKQLAIVGNDVILEANWRHNQLVDIKKVADEYGYTSCLLLVTGDDKLLFERFVLRSPTRHKAHMSMHLDESFDRYCEYIHGLRKEDLVFPVNKIDMTNLNPEEVYQVAIKILKDNKII